MAAYPARTAFWAAPAAIRTRIQRSIGAGVRRRLIVLSVLAAVNLVITAVALVIDGWFPLIVFVVPMLAASLALRAWTFAISLILQAMCVGTLVSAEGTDTGRLVECGVVVVIAAMLMTMSARSETGLPGALGESMIIDLRDRLAAQGELPPLPEQWYAQSALRSAGGAQFAGDFLVAARTPGTNRLEVTIVDVSGKGFGAGTRALQLSGALGGLLGALPGDEFLPAANRYLLRQEWQEGFATAAHVMIDLGSGDFEIRTAGHPPMLQWLAGSGRWMPHSSDGPALGLMSDVTFACASGTVSPGDALLLYTDGLVESPAQDFTIGIDRLIGEAERILNERIENSAQRLLAGLDGSSDDRALLILHRR